VNTNKRLEIIPLGGLGEFGMNMMVYRYGEDCLIIDAGMMFPGAEHLGVDVLIPNFSFLDVCGNLHGVLLTHGHEDHIGALPYLLARHDLPVYSTPHTQQLIRSRLAEHTDLVDPRLALLPPEGERLNIGPFEVEALSAAHSIPEAKMIVVRSPVGTVLHTADFKLDPNPPDGDATNLARLSELGSQGVLVLLSDSTNADQPGFTRSERTVSEAIGRLLQSSSQRVLVTMFASNIHRVQGLTRLAERFDRKLALVGSSLQNHVEVAERLGLIRFPAGVRVSAESAMNLPRDEVLFVATGSQGEPMSALARIAVGRHREIELDPGDLVIHSARRIPGNEKSIGRMIDHLLHRGAEVITAADAPVHVSGHPAQDELKLLLQLTRPKFLVPIHGEYRQLHAHAKLGEQCGLDPSAVQRAESGDVIAIDAESISIVDKVPVGQVFIDATLDEVDWSIIKERRRIAGDGIVVPVVAVRRESGAVPEYAEIVTGGFVPDTDGGEAGLMKEAKRLIAESLAEASPEERTDEALLKARIKTELKRFLRRRTQRRPLIIPVIVEL
jgi:ribonuclease J